MPWQHGQSYWALSQCPGFSLYPNVVPIAMYGLNSLLSLSLGSPSVNREGQRRLNFEMMDTAIGMLTFRCGELKSRAYA